jgi:glycosyltransferase involved in cell wall biosynthesis
MRIAQVAPLSEAVPPKLYGGTERIVSWLTEELVRLGHDVTLFASGDSRTSAKLAACVPEGLRLAGFRDHTSSHLVMLDHVRRRADEFDIIHFHVDLLPAALFRDLTHKCLTTLHGRLDIPDHMPVYYAFPEMPLVSISMSQRVPMPAHARWLANIHHGLDAKSYRFEPHCGEYLAFLGRISPEKRPDLAIEVAKQLGLPLRIAAKVDEPDREYFEKKIRPSLNHPLIEFVGEVDERQKWDFLGEARCLLFPIDWPEPFGIAMIEALACGTPVVARPCGSVPEIVRDGEVGFLGETVEQLVAGVKRIDVIDRARCRRYAEERFSVEAMTDQYEAVCARIRRERS